MARLEDYALIGDCETAALVGFDGSVDWLCWPRFDSDACFAALLGQPGNGRWLLRAADPEAKVTRRYRESTLILETRYETAEGSALVIDFMPPRGKASDLVRLVIGERGTVAMRMEILLRFGYGAVTPWVTRLEDGTLRAIAGPDLVVLRTPVGVRGDEKEMKSVADFEITADQKVPFVLTYGRSFDPPPAPIQPFQALEDTEAFWREWVSPCKLKGEWEEALIRSLITLKALTHQPTGGIVAAPTTSLPEHIGGERNWDYRFCWVRDATLTLLSLMNAGFYDEAKAWTEWLVRAVAGDADKMQIMYGIGGERRLDEWTVSWLDGYEGSRPVRVGNAASRQFQLDVYGELMGALHHARQGGLNGTESSWAVQRAVVDHVGEVWQEPDEGLWEVRGPRQHFTFSKVMAWLAVDRGIKGIEQYGLEGPVDAWKTLRDEIHADICAHGFDEKLGSFVQAYGSPLLDASLLLLPQIGFLPVDDPRVLGTIAAVEQHLLRDGLVLRYDSHETDDGLPPGEGVFLACSFWLADAYALTGREDEARALFERLLLLRNDLGLLAEEYDPRAKRLVGNFPQAFSHVALVNTALNLRGKHRVKT